LAGWLLREHSAEGFHVVSLPALAEAGDPLGHLEGEAQPLPASVSATGEVGIVASAISAVVDSSVTNFDP